MAVGIIPVCYCRPRLAWPRKEVLLMAYFGHQGHRSSGPTDSWSWAHPSLGHGLRMKVWLCWTMLCIIVIISFLTRCKKTAIKSTQWHNLINFLALFLFSASCSLCLLVFIYVGNLPSQPLPWGKWSRWKRRPMAWRHRLRWELPGAGHLFLFLLPVTLHSNEYFSILSASYSSGA